MGGSFQQQKKRKVLDKEYEELEVLGQESERQAVKEGKPILERKEKEKKERNSKLLELIQGASSGNKQSYIFFLAELLVRRMNYIGWPRGWSFEITPSDVGVIMEMTYRHRGQPDRFFRSAFKPTGEAVYDLNAINTYGIRAENTMDKIEQEKFATMEKIAHA